VLSQTDPLRVYINVPQTYAQLIKVGQDVVISQSELPGKTFRGRIARTAGAIDTATRTMQVEVTLANRDGVLFPGAFVQVALPLKGGVSTTISTNALLFGAEGIRVAVVNPQGEVTLRPIKVGKNLGAFIEVQDGLQGSEKLVLNPPDSLRDGDKVVVVAEAAGAGKGGAGKGLSADRKAP
jgi:RND family efflux transporter MFP subunit